MIGFHHLGLVGEKNVSDIMLGETKTMRIVTHNYRPPTGVTASVKLFPVNVTYETAKANVGYPLKLDKWQGQFDQSSNN